MPYAHLFCRAILVIMFSAVHAILFCSFQAMCSELHLLECQGTQAARVPCTPCHQAAPLLELLRRVHCTVPATQYSERDYWDRRYGDAAGFFDWYYGYDALREVFDAHLSRSLPILQVWLRQGFAP